MIGNADIIHLGVVYIIDSQPNEAAESCCSGKVVPCLLLSVHFDPCAVLYTCQQEMNTVLVIHIYHDEGCLL